ncbi:MAG: AAA family ATPase [Deltaproteobacteria bacterium]|nr:AAA family ATPase [Deltaproteobacteria bacterium]
MLEQVNIENFRGVRKMEVPLQRVTALLGPNSSGKTTVLHAVRMACALLERAITSDDAAGVVQRDGAPWISVTAGALLTDGAQQLSLADWQALFIDQNVPNNTTASIHLVFSAADPIQEVAVELRCANNAQIKLDVTVRADEATALVAQMPRRSPRVTQTLTAWLRERAPRAVFVPPFYGTVASEELRSRAVIDRMLGAGDQSHVVRNLVTSLSSAQYEQLSRFLDAVVGARLGERTSGDALQTDPTLRVMFSDSNGPIELSAAGAGLINLVALYAALARWGGEASRRAVLFLIDEPEAHLSPMVQADSASRIARLVTQEFRAQLVLATHSVDILNRLHRERAQLVRCDRKNVERPTKVLSGDAGLFRDLADWADLTPYTAINVLAARRILFVEGDTERALLPIFGALLSRNDDARRAAVERWAIVALDGSAKVDQPRLLSRLIQSQVLQERARGVSFEVIGAGPRLERPPVAEGENAARRARVVPTQPGVALYAAPGAPGVAAGLASRRRAPRPRRPCGLGHRAGDAEGAPPGARGRLRGARDGHPPRRPQPAAPRGRRAGQRRVDPLRLAARQGPRPRHPGNNSRGPASGPSRPAPHQVDEADTGR